MQPKPEGYVDDFTAKCGHYNAIQVNGIHSHSGNLSAMFSKSKHDCVGCHGIEIFTCRYFKLGWNTTRFNQSPFRHFLAYIISIEIVFLSSWYLHKYHSVGRQAAKTHTKTTYRSDILTQVLSFVSIKHEGTSGLLVDTACQLSESSIRPKNTLASKVPTVV